MVNQLDKNFSKEKDIYLFKNIQIFIIDRAFNI